MGKAMGISNVFANVYVTWRYRGLRITQVKQKIEAEQYDVT